MQNKVKALFPLTLLSVAVFNAGPLAAQEGAMTLEEVVVTAQRREQSMQDVPVSVTAFSGDTLQQRNITNAVDYLAITPGVSFTEDGQTGSRGMGIAVRGVNSLVSGENAFVNSIGIYLDDFSVASVPNNVANPNLADMERVEILRGPQGTYFGRNAVGGALNLTTKKPTDEFEGEVIVGLEDYDDAGESYNITGILNVPVNDSFRMRGMFYYMDSDGFVENACAKGSSLASCPGAAENGVLPTGQDGSEQESINVRLHFDWQMSDRTNALLSVYHTDDEQDTDENVPSGVLDLDSIDSFGIANGAEDPGTGFWIDGNTNKLSHDLAEGTDNKSTVAILNVTHELNDTMTLKWISGVIDAELDRFFDNDLVGGLDGIGRENSYEGTSWSTEFRLEVNDERFDFVGGVMYAKDEQDQENNVFVSSNPTGTINGTGILPPFPEGLGLALNSKEWELESWAVFADLTFHLTDRLDVVVGARYTDDEVTQSRTDYGIGPTCCFPGSPGYPGGPGFEFFQSWENFERPSSSGKEDFDQITPRVVLRYSFTDDLSMYASYSEGYKAGGLSLGNNTNEEGQPAFAIPFEEESLTNYEIGMKSEFYDNRVRLNASLYYMEWEDFQMESFRFLTPGDLSSNFEQTINIDEAEAWGGEIELLALLGEGWTFTAGLGYTDSEIKKSPIAEITGGFQVELEGLDLPKAPEFMANAAIEYRFPVGDSSEGWVQVEFVHRDGQYADIEALTYQQTDGPSPNQGLARNSIAQYGDYPFRTPDYDVWNLRAGMEMEHWAFTLYVQNLDGEDYYTGTQENFGVSGMRLRPTPRTIGGSVAYRF